MSRNFAIIELKSLKKVFDVIPVEWIYYFDQINFKKKTNVSYVCFWHSEKKTKAPFKMGKYINNDSPRQDGRFYKIYVHSLYGMFILIMSIKKNDCIFFFK